MLIEDTIFEKHGEQLNKFLKSSTSVSTLVLKFSNENLKQFIKASSDHDGDKLVVNHLATYDCSQIEMMMQFSLVLILVYCIVTAFVITMNWFKSWTRLHKFLVVVPLFKLGQMASLYLIESYCPWENKSLLIVITIAKMFFSQWFQSSLVWIWLIISMGSKIVIERISKEKVIFVVSMVFTSYLISFVFYVINRSPNMATTLLVAFYLTVIVSVCKNSSQIIQRLFVIDELLSPPRRIISNKIETMLALKLMIIALYSSKVVLLWVRPSMNTDSLSYNQAIIVLDDMCTCFFLVAILILVRSKEYQQDVLVPDTESLDELTRSLRTRSQSSRWFSELILMNRIGIPVYKWVINMQRFRTSPANL